MRKSEANCLLYNFFEFLVCMGVNKLTISSVNRCLSLILVKTNVNMLVGFKTILAVTTVTVCLVQEIKAQKSPRLQIARTCISGESLIGNYHELI